MNKKGFTLVELIAVLVLIVLVTLITFPSMKNLMKDNNAKEYETYEEMMVDYVKVIPNYKSRNYICLSELNMSPINNNINCHGYVLISGNKLTPYLYCIQNGSDVYKKNGYSSNYGC